jgi:hypothetical protein
MSEIIKSISRRRALSLFGKVAAFPVLASIAALTVSDAEAQTAGMVRRQDRRAGRHERREDRRMRRTGGDAPVPRDEELVFEQPSDY